MHPQYEMTTPQSPADIRSYFAVAPQTAPVMRKETVTCDGIINQAADGCAVETSVLQAGHKDSPAELRDATINTATTRQNGKYTRSSSTTIAKKRNKRVMSTSDSEAEKALSANANTAEYLNNAQAAAITQPAVVTHHVDSDSSSDSVYMLLTPGSAAQLAQPVNINRDTMPSQPKNNLNFAVTKPAIQRRQARKQTTRKKARPTKPKAANAEKVEHVCREIY
jgi:hypothetical protein